MSVPQRKRRPVPKRWIVFGIILTVGGIDLLIQSFVGSLDIIMLLLSPGLIVFGIHFLLKYRREKIWYSKMTDPNYRLTPEDIQEAVRRDNEAEKARARARNGFTYDDSSPSFNAFSDEYRYGGNRMEEERFDRGLIDRKGYSDYDSFKRDGN